MTDKPMSEAELSAIEREVDEWDFADNTAARMEGHLHDLLAEVRRQREKRIEERAYRNMFNPYRREHLKRTVTKTHGKTKEGYPYIDYSPIPNLEWAAAEIEKEDEG